MSTVPELRPVRHGKAGLRIHINGVLYSVMKLPGVSRCAPRWVLKKLSDGSHRSVARVNGFMACTCEDSLYRGSHCKHMRALQAVGLVGKKLRPGPPMVSAGPRAAAPPKGGAA